MQRFGDTPANADTGGKAMKQRATPVTCPNCGGKATPAQHKKHLGWYFCRNLSCNKITWEVGRDNMTTGFKARTLDEIAEEQRQILGDDMLKLMEEAAEAEELFTLDELEKYANSRR